MNGDEQPLKVSPASRTLAAVGVNHFLGATFILTTPDGMPEDASRALVDATVTAVGKDGPKSNAFNNLVSFQR